VVVHGEDFVGGILVGVDVDHPAEDDGLETAACRIARFLRGDRAFQSKLGPIRFPELSLLRHAQVGVQMPHGHAEGDARVELIFRGALGHGVHGANEFVPV